MKTILYSWLFGFGLTLVFVAPASGAVTENVRIPFSQAVFVPCADGGVGEIVLVTGRLHVLASTTVDKNGGIHGKIHFQPAGNSGVGLTTGNTYRGGGVTQEHVNISADGFPFIRTFVNNFNVIGTAGAESFQVHNTVHVTFNSDGTLTADIDNSSVTCR